MMRSTMKSMTMKKMMDKRMVVLEREVHLKTMRKTKMMMVMKHLLLLKEGDEIFGIESYDT